jgi:hypothetical protein
MAASACRVDLFDGRSKVYELGSSVMASPARSAIAARICSGVATLTTDASPARRVMRDAPDAQRRPFAPVVCAAIESQPQSPTIALRSREWGVVRQATLM